METKKSAENCIIDNDYESAIYRYEHTTRQWKDHWWNCIVTIYKNCKDFIKKYVLDSVTKTIKAIGKRVVEKVQELDYNYTRGNYTYIIEYFNELGEFVWLKVGKTIRPLKERISEHRKYYLEHSDIVLTDRVKKVFSFDTEEECVAMEDKLRDFYRNNKKSAYIPKDRFLMIRYDEQELNNFLQNA